MYGQRYLLRLQSRSNGIIQNRRTVILACTMTTILFLVFFQYNSFLHSRPTSKGQLFTDTTMNWVVSKSVTVANDPLVEEQSVDTKELKDKEIDLKEREEEETRVKEEIEEGNAKYELQENELEEGNWEGLRLGEEATSMDDETSQEDAKLP